MWDAVKNDVPELKEAVEKPLEPYGGFKALKEKAMRYAAKRNKKSGDVIKKRKKTQSSRGAGI